MNPFLRQPISSNNRFSALSEDNEEEIKPTRFNTQDKPTTYTHRENIFKLQPRLHGNVNQVEKEQELDLSGFKNSLSKNPIKKSQAFEISFGAKLREEVNLVTQRETNKKTFEESMTKEVSLHEDTPMDTLRKLCELYAYQERWGRYWYGDEKYNEMYGIEGTDRNLYDNQGEEMLHYESDSE